MAPTIKNETRWRKERASLIDLVRKGKLKLDPEFILASDGEIIQILRADLLPYWPEAAEFTLENL